MNRRVSYFLLLKKINRLNVTFCEKRNIVRFLFLTFVLVPLTNIDQLNAQLSLTNLNNPVVINFTDALSGVNASNVISTTGAQMMASSPSAGQLDADSWSISTDGATSGEAASFPGSLLAGFHTLTTAGTSPTGWGMANISSNRELAILPSSNQATPGSITLKLVNNTGFTLTTLDINYNIRAYNDQSRSNKVEFWYSSTNNSNSYTEVTSAEFISSETATNNFESSNPSFSLTSLNILNGTNYYLRFFFSDVSGSGSRDEFFLDNISITGQATTAVITGAATASPFTTTYGTPSTVQDFPVSGTGLSADITATAPTGIEVSSNGGMNWGNTATFIQTGGTASGTLSVRLKSNAAVTGSYNSQNIVLSSTGATPVNIKTSATGNSVSPAALTITGISATNKIYNANTVASLTGTAEYDGLQNGEMFSVTGTPVATFAQSSVGTGIPVTVTGYTTPTTNYTVSQPTGLTADITEKPLTISGLTANNKVHDGNTTATLSGTATLVGVEPSDNGNVTLGGTVVANFDTPDVGTNKPVTVTGYTISGSAAGNYSLSQPTGLTANITTANTPVITSSLTASGIYGTEISVYMIEATNSPDSYNASGLPGGLSVNTSNGEITGIPTVTGVFDVTISATNGDGTGSAVMVFTLNQKELTVTGATGDNKIYDRINAATISGSMLEGVVGMDDVTITNTGTFVSVTVANGITVTSTQTLGGADASKYYLTVPTGLSADITPKELTVSGAGVTPKPYDGNTDATVTGGSLNGVISPDDVTLDNTGTGTYASAGAANGISVTTTAFSLSGSDAGNYSVTQPSLTGDITPEVLTVSGITADSKVYDGNTSAVINTGSAAYQGLVNGETFSVTGTITGSFDTKNSGPGITVTIAGVDAPSTNYTVTQPTTTADITKAPLMVTGAAVTSKPYDGTTDATITGTLSGIISPDVVTLVGTGAFASPEVGTGIAVTANCTTAGADGNNYEINPQPIGLTGDITPPLPVIIVGWDFNSTTGYGVSPQSPSFLVNNLTVGGLTRGSGVTTSGTAAARAWGGNGWQSTDQATAIAANDFVTFTVKSNEGYLLSLESVAPFEYRRSSNGATNGALQYSLDGINFTDINTSIIYSSSANAGSFISDIDLTSFSALQNVPSTTTVTFRIVNWGGTTSTGTWYLYDVSDDSGVNDFGISGIVSLAVGPTASVLSNGTGNSTICAGGTANIKVTITGGASPYTVVYSDGTNNFTVNNYVSETNITVSPVSTTTYTLVSVTDNNSIPGANNSGSAMVTVGTLSVPSVVGTYSATVMHGDGQTHDYIEGSCDLLVTITDGVGGNVLGSTSVNLEVMSTVPAPNVDGYQYGRRKYSLNANSTGAASVTLYYTQADFDNYNSNNTGFLDLPTNGDNNDPNKVYFRIARVVNGSYVISGPLGDFLTWNGTESRWELTWNVVDLNADYYFTTMPSCEGIVVNNLMATNIQATSLTATWDNLITTPAWGWYSFQYRTTSPEGPWVNAGTANNGVTSRFIGGLSGGTGYEIQIRRHCSSQSTGPWSGSVAFSTPTSGCTSPPNISATTINATNIIITWPVVSGAGWYEFRYRVNNPLGNWISGGTAGSSATTRNFTNLTANTSYDIEARTYCSNGQPSSWGGITATTVGLSGCALPPDISATTINATNITITWPVVSGAGWYEFRYRVNSPLGNWISGGTLGGSATTRNFTNLTANTSYDIEARTFCSNGQPSSWGGITATTVGLSGCALPPDISATTINATNITITWPVVSGSGWYEFRYRVNSPLGSWISGGTAGGSTTTRNFTNLSASTTYDIEARTFCSNGQPSAWGRITATTTSPSGCELPPVINSTVTVTHNSATFTWPPVTGAAWYEFRYRIINAPTWTSGGTSNGNATSKVLIGLQSGTDYEFQARTFCSNGQPSAWSTSTMFMTGTIPCSVPPSNVVVSNITTNLALVSWNTVPSYGSFRVRYKLVTAQSWDSVTTTGLNTFITGLVSSSEYECQVKTICNSSYPGVTSVYGDVVTFMTASEGFAPSPALGDQIKVEVTSDVKSRNKDIHHYGGYIDISTIHIYPNPASEILNLSFDAGQIGDARISMLDISGRVVKEFNHTTIEGNNIIQINLGDLVQGVYMLQVSSVDGWLYTGRVVKTE